MGLTGISGRSRANVSDDRGYTVRRTDRVMGSGNEAERAHWQPEIG